MNPNLTITDFQDHTAVPLSIAYQSACPERQITAVSLTQSLHHLRRHNGRAWVLHAGQQPVGLATIAPLPGLPGMYGLDGFIAPSWQRQGLGSYLLQHVIDDLRDTAVTQISHAITDSHSPAACFLRHHHFTVEHEEWLLQTDSLPNQPPAPMSGLAVRAVPRARAIPLFCRLYAQSFAPFPWYQPYAADEVAADLAGAADLLFLWRGAKPIGFAWLRELEPGLGQIEPVGIVAAEQGKNYGRFLLAAALYELAQRGANRVQLGVWINNEAALAVYGRFAFHPIQTITYLAYDFQRGQQRI